MEVPMPLTVVVHLYGTDLGLNALRAFEAKILPILAAHGGTLLTAFTPSRGLSVFEPMPDEIHLIQFPSEQTFQAYRNDPAHHTLAAERALAIKKTQLIVSEEPVSYD